VEFVEDHKTLFQAQKDAGLNPRAAVLAACPEIMKAISENNHQSIRNSYKCRETLMISLIASKSSIEVFREAGFESEAIECEKIFNGFQNSISRKKKLYDSPDLDLPIPKKRAPSENKKAAQSKSNLVKSMNERKKQLSNSKSWDIAGVYTIKSTEKVNPGKIYKVKFSKKIKNKCARGEVILTLISADEKLILFARRSVILKTFFLTEGKTISFSNINLCEVEVVNKIEEKSLSQEKVFGWRREANSGKPEEKKPQKITKTKIIKRPEPKTISGRKQNEKQSPAVDKKKSKAKKAVTRNSNVSNKKVNNLHSEEIKNKIDTVEVVRNASQEFLSETNDIQVKLIKLKELYDKKLISKELFLEKQKKIMEDF
jgi:hypothetical protein